MHRSIASAILPLAAAAALALAATAHAALMTWAAPATTTGDSDVSTAGTLIAAANIGDTTAATTTVNGVPFLPWNSNSFTSFGIFSFSAPVGGFVLGGSPAGPFSNLSASYRNLLLSSASNNSSVNGNGPVPISFTLAGLTPGNTYAFEWWSSVPVSAFASATSTATAGASVTLAANPTGVNGGLGQFALGTFTADAITQDMTISVSSIMNAVQLRQIPEPATATLLALGVGGLLARRRRR